MCYKSKQKRCVCCGKKGRRKVSINQRFFKYFLDKKTMKIKDLVKKTKDILFTLST